MLMGDSYVENTLVEHRLFDKEGLLAEDPSYEGRLKCWTNDLCRSSPHTFDFVVTVRCPLPSLYILC